MDSLRWNAHEYNYSEKSVDWFWGVGLGAAAIAVIAIVFDNILLAILIVIAAFAVAVISIRKPRELEFELTNKGIRAGSEFHAWSGLESFWLEERTDPPRIIFVSKRFLTPHIIIPLGDVDLDEVHEALLTHLSQVEHHESVIDLIAERLGF